jgi:hypothetical protein
MRKNQRQSRGPTLEGNQSAGANATPHRDVQDVVAAKESAPTIAFLDVTGSLVLGVALAVSLPVLALISHSHILSELLRRHLVHRGEAL